MRQGVGNAISIMGARPTSNNFMIDGTSNIDTALGTPAAILSVDAIQEFKEQTTTYSAEYGFSANQINIVSKSGTNAFHGTAFGFIRNEKLDARNFFDPADADKPKLDQKQSGFVVGGPDLHRNKTFFLFNYEGDADQARVQLVLHRARHRTSWPATSRAPSSTRRPGSRSRTTRFRSRASRGWRKLAVQQVHRRRTPTRRRATIRWSARCRRTRTSTPSASITISANTGRSSAASRRRRSTTSRRGSVSDIGDTAFEQDTTNWQVSHTLGVASNLVNKFRFGRVEATADQGASIAARSRGRHVARADRRLHRPDRTSSGSARASA